MRHVLVDPYSVCACPLTMVCNTHHIGSATGFFWKHNNTVYSISNWHVFSSRNPFSGKPKHPKLAVPDAIKVTASIIVDINNNFTLTIAIYDENDQLLWLQSKEYGQKADLAIYNITNCLRNLSYKANNINLSEHIACINEAPHVTDMFSGVGSEVFVLWFSLGIMKTGIFPVWKRASIATEFQYDVNNMPSFLIDTATREGMSGAPVIQRSTHGYKINNGDTAFGGTANQMLGVYSGRYIGELDEAHLDIVWKVDFIEQIITNPCPGSYIYINECL